MEPGSLLSDVAASPKLSYQIPEDILMDLCTRFVINVPKEEKSDVIRVCFQIELAHWFYLDHCLQEFENLQAVGMKQFARQVFKACPFLIEKEEERSVEDILEEWKGYKMSVPTYGAILLDKSLEYCLLVQGYWAKVSWGFPKGKVNEEEAPTNCAIREVNEETGFDISEMINENDFLEHHLNEQLIRLYIIPGVPKDTEFKPKTRQEIKSLEWFALNDLPVHKKDQTPKSNLGLNPNSFFTVIPFVKNLRKWVTRYLGNSAEDELGVSVKGKPKIRQGSRSMDEADRKKQKERMQQYFQQQNQNEMSEYLPVKTLRGGSASPSNYRNQKQTGKESVLNSGYKSYFINNQSFGKNQHVQILNRNSNPPEQNDAARKSLLSEFKNPGEKRSFKKVCGQDPDFGSAAWDNFCFDRKKILACFE